MKETKLFLFLGVFGNLILGLTKIVLGSMISAISIVSDGINNFEDSLTNIVNIVGNKLAFKKADASHPFGHYLAEYITSLIIAIIIVFTGVEVLKEAVLALLSPENITYTSPVIVLLFIGIAYKTILALVYFISYKKRNIESYKGLFFDSILDVLSQSTIVIGIIISRYFNIYIDPYLAILVSLLIIYNGINIMIDSINKLLNQKIDTKLLNSIKQELLSSNYVKGLHDFIAHNYGRGTIFVSVHVELDSTLPFDKVHEIIDALEISIKEKYKVDITIHPDPLDLQDLTLVSLRENLQQLLNKISLTCHDVRKIGGIKNRFVFDIVVPFEYIKSHVEIKNYILDNLSHVFEGLEVVINYDSQYSSEK